MPVVHRHTCSHTRSERIRKNGCQSLGEDSDVAFDGHIVSSGKGEKILEMEDEGGYTIWGIYLLTQIIHLNG